MTGEAAGGNWNSYGRIHASQRWRKPSAAMGRYLTEAIVAEAKVERGMRVLDVASGSGEPAISIATLLAGTGTVIATDISSQPLELARERARQRGLTNVEFRTADVHDLGFEEGSFDRVTSRLGVMFFADPARAFREMCRVLKPGGRATMLAWGTYQQPYFQTTIGTILQMLPDAALPASGAAMFKFGEPGTLTDALRPAGFAQVDERTQTLPWTWPGTPEEVWEYFQEVTIPFKPLFQAVPDGQRKEIDAAVIQAIRRFYLDGEVRFSATVVLASATK